jgi:hypothetical protein
VAAKLADNPELLGEGHLHRIAVEAQRQFWPAPAVGGAKRAGGKYR